MLTRHFVHHRSSVQAICRSISSVSFSTGVTRCKQTRTLYNLTGRHGCINGLTCSNTTQIRTFSHEVENSITDRIRKLVKNNQVVVFMKGVPEQPMCGFSNAVVQVLRMHGVENYDAHNVLDDDELRQGIKEYSDWPTIPQVYFDGEFIGGCDIMLQLHQNGELIDELKKIGIESTITKK